jgi:D-alanyl-D-alanine carboxypeptidase
VVVNKIRPLKPITYKPRDLVYYNGVALARVTSDSLVKLAFGMKKAGAGTLRLNSGYRAYSTQSFIYKDRVARLGLKAGEALAARPGYSEHQTGLAADVSAVGQGCVIQVCFGSTKAGKWIAANASQYGFIVRYPNGKTPITGYQYEPWHLRFVGIEIATDMRAKKISVLETYWGLPAAPTYLY